MAIDALRRRKNPERDRASTANPATARGRSHRTRPSGPTPSMIRSNIGTPPLASGMYCFIDRAQSLRREVDRLVVAQRLLDFDGTHVPGIDEDGAHVAGSHVGELTAAARFAGTLGHSEQQPICGASAFDCGWSIGTKRLSPTTGGHGSSS